MLSLIFLKIKQRGAKIEQKAKVNKIVIIAYAIDVYP